MQPSRYALIIKVEQTALICRCILLAAIIPFYFTNAGAGGFLGLAALASAIFAHNAFTHWVLATGSIQWFASRLNLAIHLVEVAVIISLTGGWDSPAFVLFILIITGCCAYTGSFQHIMVVMGFALVSHVVGVLVAWFVFSDSPDLTCELVIPPVVITCAGWLVARTAGFLWQAEEAAAARSRALADSEATLRTILNCTADPIMVCDDMDRIAEANQPACEFLNMPHEKLIGRAVRGFIFDDGSLPQRLGPSWEQETSRTDEMIIDNQGRELHVEVRTRSFIRDGKRFFVILLHDITTRKHLQETTRLANQHLEWLNRELREVDRLKTDFLSLISQRLRSPLAAVNGFMDALLDEEMGPLNSDQNAALVNSRRCLERVFQTMDEAQQVGQIAVHGFGETRRTATAESSLRRSTASQ